jgi:hypothetical protein
MCECGCSEVHRALTCIILLFLYPPPPGLLSLLLLPRQTLNAAGVDTSKAHDIVRKGANERDLVYSGLEDTVCKGLDEVWFFFLFFLHVTVSSSLLCTGRVWLCLSLLPRFSLSDWPTSFAFLGCRDR